MLDRTGTEKEELLAAYQTLAPFEQTVLQLVSVIYEPVNTATIVNCLRRAGIKDPDGLNVTIASLVSYIEELRDLKLLNGQNRCHASVLELASQEAVTARTYGAMARAVQDELPVSFYYSKRSQTCWRAMREFRIAVYSQDQTSIENLDSLIKSQCGEFIKSEYPLVRVCTDSFQPDWFGGLSNSFKFYALDQIFSYSLQQLDYLAGPVAYLAEAGGQGGIARDESLPFHRLLADYLVWRGSIDRVNKLIADHGSSFTASGFSGCTYFLSGDNDRAIKKFEAELAELREITANKKAYFYGVPGLLFILALLKKKGRSELTRVSDFIAAARQQQQSTMLNSVYSSLGAVILALKNQVEEADRLVEEIDFQENCVARLFASLAGYWLNGELAREDIDELASLFSRADSNGFDWLALEYAELLGRVSNEGSYAEYATEIREKTGLHSIINIIDLGEAWERRLKALIRSTSNNNRAAAYDNGKGARLVWLASYNDSRMTVVPREQHILKSGGWSKGRPVALSRLYSGKKIDSVTEQDRRICRAIRREHSSRGLRYHFEMDQALLAMIGHPLIFLEDSPTVPLEFVKGEPELIVEQAEDRYRIKLAKDISEDDIAVSRETMTRFRIIQVTDRHRKIARIIGTSGLTVPESALEQVMVAIGNISSFMTVHSAVNGKAADIDEITADAGIHIQLLPVGVGFRLKIYVKPFAIGGPYLKPGKGKENIIAEVKGQRLQTRRDLKLEAEKAQEVEAACPTLALFDENDWEWDIPHPEECLQVLLELQEIRDRVTIEWPEGGRVSVSHQVSFDQLSMKIRRRRNWFELSGRIELDENLILDMKAILKAVRENPGRFVSLGDGRFLALTDEFRQRLDEINTFAEGSLDSSSDEAVRIHPLSVTAFEEITEDLAGLQRLDVDADWQEQIKLIREARELKPLVPSTLKAELRDYQVEGFYWLARLAHWGMGACLADDMGLGKTLQALAIILTRAAQGPTLVVAPTSVCMNWQSEANRFAPTLNIIIFGNGNSRKKLVKNLKGFDVLVTSYNLLQQEAELLASVEWQTIVLDEAQAIKNMVTKRSRAAMSLNGRFKLITTGTPIENHLGELWNLFNFICPGLLGSLDMFNRRFAIPIERHQDREARKRLKKLIRPFILRRIKSQVLEELPSRTEIVLHPEMGDEEAAFYEALRRQALDNLQSLGGLPNRNMQILAEIMRLRRACCNAKLVAPESQVASSKLELFGKVVDELLENRHKALVFSQFVGHLSIIREFLDAKGISYCYLDGSTPVKERKKQVTSFQAGTGDLFLISLKAGGVGLNLTAADYVIHMDPWWNPAVEDQASDRAHRIGQKHPVTIYRLVSRNTIEEKIVKLHQEKRDLANSLLEGSDVSAMMSAEDLLNLIREQ